MTRPFDPLRADHPMVGAPCALCGEPMRVGERPTLIAIPGTGDGRIAEAAPAHWTCHSVPGHAELRRVAEAAQLLLAEVDELHPAGLSSTWQMREALAAHDDRSE